MAGTSESYFAGLGTSTPVPKITIPIEDKNEDNDNCIKKWLKELCGEEEDNDNWIKKCVEELCREEEVYRPVCQSFSDQAFDPVTTRKVIASYEPNVQLRKKDLGLLVGLALSKGPNFLSKRHIWSKLSTEGKTKLIKLQGTYHIDESRKALDQATTITLYRILNAYPELAFHYLKSETHAERPISVEIMTIVGYEGFLSELRGSFVFKLIPKGASLNAIDNKKHEAVVKGVLAYMVEEEIVLSRTRQIKDKSLILASIISHAQDAHMSGLIPPTKRVEYFANINLLQSTADQWCQNFNTRYPKWTDVSKHF